MAGQKVLHLTLKKKWFDMIASGEKTEEYRELSLYWKNRLHPIDKISGARNDDIFMHFDVIKFTNGYRKDSPSFIIECLGISVDIGYVNWGAENDKYYFVIKLGKILKPRDLMVIKK